MQKPCACGDVTFDNRCFDCWRQKAETAETERDALRAQVEGLTAERDSFRAKVKECADYALELREMEHQRDSAIAAMRGLHAKVNRGHTTISALEKALRESYEVWAGMDGVYPKTAPESYLQRVIAEMVEPISAALLDKPGGP